MNEQSLGMRTWKFAVLALALVTNGACPSDDGAMGDPDSNRNEHDGGGGGGGGDTPPAPADNCKDASSVVVPGAKGHLISDFAADDDAIYYSLSSGDSESGIYRLPKSGGAPVKIGDTDYLIGGGPILLDGDWLYYGDSRLHRMKKDGSGEPEMLAEAKGGISEITQDDEAIYFVHGASCCESLGTDTTQHMMRFDKASGAATEVVAAPAMESLVIDGENVFWIGSFEKDDPDADPLDGNPRSLIRTPLAGGDSVTLFAAPKDLSGLNPGSAFGRGLAVTDSEVIFGSLNLKEFSSGIYRISKTAKNGTPTEIVTNISFSSGFVLGSAVYTSNGDAIDRIDLKSGDKTQVACGGATLTPTYLMFHDDANIYYVRHTRHGADDSDVGQELRKIALPK